MSRRRYIELACVIAAFICTHSVQAGDVSRGAGVFSAECVECHSVKAGKNKKGPSLFGVIGRKAASINDFIYSDAMRQSGITWTPDQITRYVANPKKVVPGGKMKYDGHINPQETEDLLAYLNTIR